MGYGVTWCLGMGAGLLLAAQQYGRCSPVLACAGVAMSLLLHVLVVVMEKQSQ